MGAKIDWGQFFKDLIADLIAAIIQALILRAIMSAFGGFASGGVTGGGQFAGNYSYTAQRGLLVPGADFGRDVVPIMARPGEAILPPNLTRLLLRAADDTQRGRSGGDGEIVIELRADIPLLVERMNTGVRRGRVRVLATKVV